MASASVAPEADGAAEPDGAADCVGANVRASLAEGAGLCSLVLPQAATRSATSSRAADRGRRRNMRGIVARVQWRSEPGVDVAFLIACRLDPQCEGRSVRTGRT